MRHIFLYISLFAVVAIGHSAELVTLSAENYDEYRPRGKEADAIIGDYVLRNDKIVAAVADPTLLMGRSAQRWAIMNVAGTLIDLTTRENPNDLLTVYYPAKWRFKPDAPQKAEDFVDERDAHTQPGRQPQQGKRVSLTMPRYEMTSGKMLQEIAKLPAHLRGAPKTYIDVTYTLEDGWDYIQVEVTYTNPMPTPDKLHMFTSLRLDGAVERGFAADDGDLGWVQNAWWGQAYGVLPVGHRQTHVVSRGRLDLVHEHAKKTTLKPGESITVTHRIFPAADLAGVRAIAAAQRGQALHPHTVSLETGAGDPIAEAPVRIYQGDALWGERRSDAKGMVRIDLPDTDLRIVATPFGRSAKTLQVKGGTPGTHALTFPVLARAVVTIADPDGKPLPAKVAFRGMNGTPDPDFFPTSGDVAVRNLRYTANGRVEQELPDGTYDVLVTYGPEYSVHRQRIVADKGSAIPINAVLKRQVDTTGWISAETHNHSTLSHFEEIFYVYPYEKDPTANGDSVASTRGRVLNLLAEHVEFAVPTEHNWIADYAPILRELGAESRMATVPGIGLTAGRRHTVDHQNAWPMMPIPGKQDGGAPQRQEHIGQLDFMYHWYDDSEKLVQLVNVSTETTRASAQADMLDVIDLLPIIDRKPLPGRDNRILEWLEVLRKGYRLPGIANEGRFDNFHGSGGLRNYVASPTDDPAEIKAADVMAAMKAGHVIMTTGPFMTVTMTMDGKTAIPGDDIVGATGELHITVQSAGGITMDRVQILVNGENVADLTDATDGFSDRRVPIALKEDGFVIVVASGTGPNLRGGDAETVAHVAVSNPIWVDATGDGYSPHSPLHDAVVGTLDFIEAPLARPDAPPGRVRLHLKNTGPAPATDEVTLTIIPPDAARIIGGATKSYSLPYQGAETNVEWEIAFNEDYLEKNFPMTSTYNNTKSFGIRTNRSGTFPGRRPNSLYMHIDNAVLSLPPMDDLGAVEEALAGAVVYPVHKRRSTRLGEMRFGVSGDNLAVTATVIDRSPMQHKIVHEGSCVEIFGSMPGRNPANKEKSGNYYSIYQVYLVPAVGDAPASAWRRISETDENVIPAPEIRIASRTTADGYTITALIPLAQLGVDVDRVERMVYLNTGYMPVEMLDLVPRAGRFLIETRFNTRLKAGGPKEIGTIFSSPAPHVDHNAAGRMRLDGRAAATFEIVEPLPATVGAPPGRARLALTNVSQQPIDDTVTLVLEDADFATIRGDATVAVRLAPGASMSHDFQIDLTTPTMASGLHLVILRSPRGQITRVPSPMMPLANRPVALLPPTALADVATALAEQPALPLMIGETEAATVRFAVAGDTVIMDVAVVDSHLKRGDRPWKGSLVEIFGVTPGVDTIHQVFLLPSDGELPAEALLSQAGKQVPIDSVALQSQATETGYRLQAVVPLAILGGPDAKGRLKLEFQLSTTLGGEDIVYGTVFNSSSAYRDHSYYGRYQIKRP